MFFRMDMKLNFLINIFVFNSIYYKIISFFLIWFELVGWGIRLVGFGVDCSGFVFCF